MTPTGHAVALLAIVGVTLAACIALRRSPRKLPGLFAALVSLFLAALMPGHLCDAGHPWPQLLIGSACVTALVVFVRDRRAAAGLVIGIAIFSGWLAWDYEDLVHLDGVTGNPHPGEERRRLRSVQRARDSFAETTKSDLTIYPEGWLFDLEFARNRRPDSPLGEIPESLTQVEVQPFWHSWFTRLYSCRRRHGSLWYPGGTLADAAPRIEWRERNFK